MHAIGIDIGGTKIGAGVVDDEGNILRQTRRDTEAGDPRSIELAVIDAYRELSEGYEIGAVGVAAAGFVSEDRASMRFAPNLAWRDHPLRERLAEGISVPIVIENDANAAGWAEYAFGVGRGTKDMVMLTIGTGLGGAVIVGGNLVRGAYGVAAEIGHMRVVPGGQYCGCGHEGCWEQYASGSALVRWAREALITDPQSAQRLAELCDNDPAALRGPDVTKAAQEGDWLAIRLLEQLGAWIGEGMASVAALLDPELFVIGGGVSAAGDLLLLPAREAYLRELSARGHRPEARIEIAALANDAGIVGAAALAGI